MWETLNNPRVESFADANRRFATGYIVLRGYRGGDAHFFVPDGASEIRRRIDTKADQDFVW